jgi:hypothetical protein
MHVFALRQESYLNETGANSSGLVVDQLGKAILKDYLEVDGCPTSNILVSANAILQQTAGTPTTIRSLNSGKWGCQVLTGGRARSMAAITYTTNTVGGLLASDQWLDPFDYGTVADASTSDTTAINTAIIAASNNGGGVIRFQPGKIHAIHDPLTLTSYVRLEKGTMG